MSTSTAPSDASTSTQRSRPSLRVSRRLVERLFGEAQGKHLPALEPERGATYGVGTQCASTSSVRMPPAVFGCRNATCVPRMPVRGVSSISRNPASLRRLQRGADIRHLVGDVMQARAPRGEELPHRRVLGQGLQQLHMAFADVEQHGLDALLRDRLAVHERHAVRTGVEVDRGLEVGDRNPDVVDAAEHASECIFERTCGSPSSSTAPPVAAAVPPRIGEEFAIDELDRIPPDVDRIAVAGGDGSIAPVAELAGRLGVPLAVIPTGTANDFARAHGLPLDVDAAARLALHGESTQSLELGHLAPGGRSSTSPRPGSRASPDDARSR